jgi:hypothetical protein
MSARKKTTPSSPLEVTAAPAEAVAGAELEMPAEFQGLSLQEIQRRIAAADLQAKLLELDRITDENHKRIAKKEALERFNRQIQEDIRSQQKILEYAQSVCRHKQGGRYQNVWAGDGKPCVSRTQMLDGYTWLLQCLRCRMKILTPHPALQRSDPEKYAKNMAIYNKLWELAADSGFDEIRGPTFIFMKDGVPFIPMLS